MRFWRNQSWTALMHNFPDGSCEDPRAPWNEPLGEDDEAEDEPMLCGRPLWEPGTIASPTNQPIRHCDNVAHPESEGAMCAECEVRGWIDEANSHMNDAESLADDLIQLAFWQHKREEESAK